MAQDSDTAPFQPLARATADMGPDAALTTFLDWLARQKTTPYPAQEEAFLALAQGAHVVLDTPTGSGKSLVATFHHYLSLCAGRTSVYTCPIKALVSEKFFNLCKTFGAQNVGMLTGDASINRNAPILCCTAEILAQMALNDGDACAVDDVIMDEFHYFADLERGTAWQLPLLILKRAQFLLMSATLGDISDITEALARSTQKKVSWVKSTIRPVPLDFSYSEVPLTETLAALAKSQRTPVYVVYFSQREAAEAAQAALSTDFLNKADKQAIKQQLIGFRFDTPFGKTIQRTVLHGVGIHHAGMLPKYRLLVEKLAQAGRLSIIMGTDTLGVGINVPLRTVVLTKLCKFNGQKTAVLGPREFKQISGRAGRAGFDAEGSVVCQAPEHVIENMRLVSRAGDDPKKLRKVIKKKAPPHFVPWDKTTFNTLVSTLPEPLVGSFVLSHSMLLTVLRQDSHLGMRRIIKLIGACHERPAQKKRLRRKARELVRALIAAGVIEHHRPPCRPAFVVNTKLGDAFALTQPLTLFLLACLPDLAIDDDYALNILSLVESIMESPQAILAKQLDHKKQARLSELKAMGVDYEERIAELEKIEIDKPLADFIYPRFNVWSASRPWVGQDNIRPKNIARQMVEGYQSFVDVIQMYGLQRAEGVLLRYLSQLLRALRDAVPKEYVTEELLQVEAFLRAVVGRTDASLIKDWQALTAPSNIGEAGAGDVPERARMPEAAATQLQRLKRDSKALRRRLSTEAHQVVAALARSNFEAAAQSCLWPDETTETAEAVEHLMRPFIASCGAPEMSGPARLSEHTRIDIADAEIWRVEQNLVSHSEATGWAICFELRLNEVRDFDGPLLFFRDVVGS